ncbi:MAG: FAD-dependent oxidoreductase [Hyphomicrobiaceae bacterium]
MPDRTSARSIVVVGAGISGLAAAWLLAKHHRVTLVESAATLGGHAHTVIAPARAGRVAVDTGFIVYNTETYPNLIALFDHLGVETRPAPMSFAVSLDEGRYEYSGSGLAGFLGQPSNALSLPHWRLAAEIVRFNREAARLAAGHAGDDAMSLESWLTRKGYSGTFRRRYILPMAAAIWSTPAAGMLDFPAATFARFFANHGLLTVAPRPTWRTVVGGSRAYVDRLAGEIRGEVVSGDGVVSVARASAGPRVHLASGRVIEASHVLLTCHADMALSLLADADEMERGLLGAFRYTANEAVLHSDVDLMPRRRRLWSSWNYIGRRDGGLSVTYWMNALQSLSTSDALLVTLNPTRPIDPALAHSSHRWHHPLFDAAAMGAQRRLWDLQGRRRTWFAGSYFGYGFHEDGLQAGLAVAEALGGARRPWTVVGASDRVLSGVGPTFTQAAPAMLAATE